MCGIAGAVGTETDDRVLARMGRAIAHRGPDEATETVLDNAGLAFRRLSIIDVAGGQQPIWNERGDCAILLNGEIYNYRDLRADLEAKAHQFRTRSDVETVLHLWEDKGAGCLADLRGMFALAIWDQKRQELFLARDRLGKKPLYYTEAAGGLVFASEIKAILQHPIVKREPDMDALELFLSFHFVPSPLTAFEGIRRLPPAHWLRWKAGRIETHRYWDLEYTGDFAGSEADLVAEIRTLLDEAVRIRLESEVPLGAFLSGGLDSSTVVALAAQALSRPLKTFAIAFGNESYDESPYARLVAERFSTEHHELRLDAAPADTITELVWHYDQPFGDSSAIPSLQVARITRPHVTVVLTGDGGDETFAGYDRYRLARMAGWYRLPASLLQAVYTVSGPFGRFAGRAERILRARPRTLGAAYLAALYQPPVGLNLGRGPTSLESRFQAATGRLQEYFASGAGPLDSMLAADLHSYLPDDLLIKVDVATMAHSLEARSPMLDHRLMELVASAPAATRLGRQQGKPLLRKAMQDVLPPEIGARGKKGFGVPLSQWLRSDLRDLMRDTLLSSASRSTRYFDRPQVERMVRETLAGAETYRYLLWDLIMLELWHRAYIEQGALAPAI